MSSVELGGGGVGIGSSAGGTWPSTQWQTPDDGDVSIRRHEASFGSNCGLKSARRRRLCLSAVLLIVLVVIGVGVGVWYAKWKAGSSPSFTPAGGSANSNAAANGSGGPTTPITTLIHTSSTGAKATTSPTIVPSSTARPRVAASSTAGPRAAAASSTAGAKAAAAPSTARPRAVASSTAGPRGTASSTAGARAAAARSTAGARGATASSTASAGAAVASSTGRGSTPSVPASRNPLLQPFATTSIWNMPIGENAVYVPAGLSGTPGNNIWATMPGADEEHLLLDASAPLTAIQYSSVGWSGGDRCPPTPPVHTLVSVPFPTGYLIPNNNLNSATVHLQRDGRTLLQLQPTARCAAGQPGTALIQFEPVDLYGDGTTGAHGGSGLSSIGGSIRLGELRPSGGLEGPRHALKINVYAAEALFQCTTKQDCFRWPAIAADSYAVGTYGTATSNTNRAMKMGALLAIPPTTTIASLGLETTPARQLAWTLQNYGAYIVDDTYAPGFALSTEVGPQGSKVDEFARDWGFAFVNKVNYAASSAWVRDIQRLLQSLAVVDNNTASTIGGGGKPRQPLAPPIAP